MHDKEKRPSLISLAVLIIIFCITFFAVAKAPACADTIDEIQFFSKDEETIFNADEGCLYHISLPDDTANFRLYLDDFNQGGDFSLIATTFSAEESENVTLVQIEKETPPESSSVTKYVEFTFLKNGIYKAYAYENENEEPIAEGERVFQGIDFYAPLIGRQYTVEGVTEWVIYEDFYFEGQSIVLLFTADDTKTPINSSASSGIKEINIYYSSVLYEGNIDVSLLTLKKTISFNRHNVQQKYNGEFKADVVGYYYFQSGDWVGNSQTYPPFYYSEQNTDLYVFLASVENKLKEQGYSNLLKSNLQASYDYYREIASDPLKSQEEKDAALSALVADKRSYDEAKVNTVVEVKGEQITGLTAFLTADSYKAALKGDTLRLELSVTLLSRDYKDERVLSVAGDSGFEKAYKISALLYFNNTLVSPDEDIVLYIPTEEYACSAVVAYNVSGAAQEYTSLPFEQGDKWITFAHSGGNREYVILLSPRDTKDTGWVLWLIIGAGFSAVVGVSIFLAYKYKKEHKRQNAPASLLSKEPSVSGQQNTDSDTKAEQN